MRWLQFASLERPTWRYRIYHTTDDNPSHDWRNSQYSLSSYISQYDTMGDGETQHCADCRVPSEQVMDVVFSLATSLDRFEISLENEESGIESLETFWRDRPSVDDKDIQFLLSLKFTEKKDTYYTLHGDRKKSHNDDKRYDKRWVKLERPYDDNETTVHRICRMIPPDDMPHGSLQWVATVARIAALAEPDNDQWTTVRHLRGDGKGVFNHPKYDIYEFLTHFRTISQFVESVRLLRWSRQAAKRRRIRLQEELQQSLATA